MFYFLKWTHIYISLLQDFQYYSLAGRVIRLRIRKRLEKKLIQFYKKIVTQILY